MQNFVVVFFLPFYFKGISPSEINKTASRMWRQLGPEGQRVSYK